MLVKMFVQSVRTDLLGQHHFVVLQEVGRERYLSIAIGPGEAGAIAIKLLNIQVARLLTHDLIAAIIPILGGKVTQVLINDEQAGTFFARIVLDVDGRHVEVDSRPSDALALALRTGVDIFVNEEEVLDKYAQDLGQVPKPLQAPPDPRLDLPPEERVNPSQLAFFRDALEGINLDNLGKP